MSANKTLSHLFLNVNAVFGISRIATSKPASKRVSDEIEHSPQDNRLTISIGCSHEWFCTDVFAGQPWESIRWQTAKISLHTECIPAFSLCGWMQSHFLVSPLPSSFPLDTGSRCSDFLYLGMWWNCIGLECKLLLPPFHLHPPPLNSHQPSGSRRHEDTFLFSHISNGLHTAAHIDVIKISGSALCLSAWSGH